jgi:competence protein ComEA
MTFYLMKAAISEYFNFTRKERNGVIVISVLIIISTTIPFLYPLFVSHKKYDHSEFEKEIAALNIRQTDSATDRAKYHNRNYEHNYRGNYTSYEKQATRFELFYFDPNVLDAEGWEKLGIRKKTIETIQKYVSKGGRFDKAEDLKKIWGLHEDEVRRMMPYVRISSGDNQISNAYSKESHPAFERKSTELKPFDINTADTSLFIALPGIGSKLANRIVSFREKLGGFNKVEQVAETYGLPDSVFQKIKNKFLIYDHMLKQIDINTAAMDELKQHPYIRYVLANAIVQYRTQHGKYRSVSDLQQIQIMTNELYEKLLPYLTVK